MTAVSATDFESWRTMARNLITLGVHPSEVQWSSSNASLFEATLPSAAISKIAVPSDFIELAKIVALHRDEQRWASLYRALYRITHGEHDLLRIDVDDDVRHLR